jgi:hypothetical protein
VQRIAPFRTVGCILAREGLHPSAIFNAPISYD